MSTVGSAIPAARLPALRSSLRRTLRAAPRHPVVAATVLSALLHLVWVFWLANDAGDLSAQYAWTDFARQHPDSAYNLSWYGGMHIASYSVLSPYLMSFLGVRTTGALAGIASAGFGALLLTRSGVSRPMWPALFTAFALWCDVASGRVTFALGLAFGLAATVVAFTCAGPRLRGTLLFVLAALGTMSSPVVGVFLEVAAAGLFLTGRRRDSYPLLLAPAVVVGATTLLFPFSGVQPFSFHNMVLVVAAALAVILLVPREWAAVRRAGIVYVIGTVLVFLIPSPVGSNVERLSLLFAGTALLAALTSSAQSRKRAALTLIAFLSVAGWITGRTIGDLLATAPKAPAARDGGALINELQQLGADRGRVEVVPLSSHWEASGVAPYVDLARGWNRQADVTRNPLFYATKKLTADDYHGWLRQWGVGYVALSSDKPDNGATDEAALIRAGQPWLKQVWQHGAWTVYQVADATPLADPPAVVEHAGAASMTVDMPVGGTVRLKVPWSPWLGVGHLDSNHGCLRQSGDWTELYAPTPGTYRISGDYGLGRGNPCNS